jgi:hypothetical protein
MSSVYRRNPQLAGRVIDGLAFIVTPDDNKLHTLNAQATLVWKLAADGFTVADAAAALVRDFQVDLDTATRDVATCCEDLVRRRILIADER